MIRIFTDIACDITKSRAQEWQVECINLPITFEDGIFEQNEEEDFTRFYEKLAASRTLPQTSQPVFGDLIAKFSQLKEREEEGICITLSATISGTYDSCCKAKELAGASELDIIDSKSGTAGQMQLVRYAVELRKQGKSREEIVRLLNESIRQIETMAVIDDLECLKKGGRIPPALALLGKAIKIKPILCFNTEGKLVPYKKERGRKVALQRMIATMLDCGIQAEHPVLIGYTSNRELAEEVRERLKEELPQAVLELHPVSGVIGTHIGEDCVCISAFVTKRLTESA